MSPWRTLSVTRSKSAWHLLSRSANHLWVTRLIPATPSLLPLPCCCSPRGAGPFQTVRAPQCLLWEDQVDGECHVPAAGGVDGGVQGRDGGGAQAGDGEEGRRLNSAATRTLMSVARARAARRRTDDCVCARRAWRTPPPLRADLCTAPSDDRYESPASINGACGTGLGDFGGVD